MWDAAKGLEGKFHGVADVLEAQRGIKRPRLGICMDVELTEIPFHGLALKFPDEEGSNPLPAGFRLNEQAV